MKKIKFYEWFVEPKCPESNEKIAEFLVQQSENDEQLLMEDRKRIEHNVYLIKAKHIDLIKKSAIKYGWKVKFWKKLQTAKYLDSADFIGQRKKTIKKRKVDDFLNKKKNQIFYSREQVEFLLNAQREEVRQHVDHCLRDRGMMTNEVDEVDKAIRTAPLLDLNNFPSKME